MRRSYEKFRHFAAIAFVLGALGPAAASAASGPHPHVVGGKYQNPRGLELSPNGNLIYVAAAGKGGKHCQTIPGQGTSCAGTSGYVSQLNLLTHERVKLVEGLPSFAPKDGTFAKGVNDVSRDPDGSFYAVETNAPTYQVQQLPKASQKFDGQLMRITQGARPVADIAGYEYDNDPDGQGLASDPSGVDASSSGSPVVVDAAANDVLQVHSGTISLFDWLANIGAAPATPTAITRGPNGNLFVGESGQGGGGRVVQILPGGIEVVYASGLSHITGLDFGASGILYVTELTTSDMSPSSRGAVVEVMPLGLSRCTVPGSEQLVLPSGAVISPDGQTLYVSNHSMLPADTPVDGPWKGAVGQVVSLPADPNCT
jgi:DNA-binding beta-propeller fold protein YncE